LVLPTTANVVILNQDTGAALAYLSVVYTTSGADPGTATVSLVNMTGVTYTTTNLGTGIGPQPIFTLTPGTVQYPLIAEVNTATLTPAGPYTTTVSRSVAIRFNVTAANRFVLLSISIGWAAA